MTFNIQFNKFGEPNYPYIYEILHKPTGSVYVGVSEANKRYENGYWGSASGKSNQLMHRQTILKNIQDYQKTILMYFQTWDEAAEYEKKKIKEYFKEYGNLCLNRNVGGVLKRTKEQASAAGKKGGKIAGPKAKGTVYIHKNGETRRCYKDELEQKILEGWIKGQAEEFKTNQGENNPTWGKNPYANRSEEQMEETRKKCSNSAKKPKSLYYCPYDKSIIKIANGINGLAQYIKKNYPNEKQWMQYTYKEKQKFKI